MPATPSDLGQNPGETPDLRAEIVAFIGEDWLHAPNSWFSGRPPAALLGTGEENQLRDLVTSILVGDFS